MFLVICSFLLATYYVQGSNGTDILYFLVSVSVCAYWLDNYIQSIR